MSKLLRHHSVAAPGRISSSRSCPAQQKFVPGAVSCRSRTRTAAAHTRLRGGGSTAAAQPTTGRAVVSPLVGKNVLQLSPGLSTVPLLDPTSDNLPFAASLQIYSSDGSAAASTSTQQHNHQHASTLVELHYVISGNGYFSNAASGVQQALWPGDSIISLHGAATFAAGPMPGADTSQQQQHQQEGPEGQQGSSPAWSQLLGWLQQLHAKTQQQQQQQQQQHLADARQQTGSSAQPAVAASADGHERASSDSASNSQLVMLQLLLPSELLTGEMLHHTAAHCQAVAQQLPWGAAHPARQQAAGSSSGSAAGGEAASAGSIHEGHVCGLLADAGLASPTSQAEQSHSAQGSAQHQHQQHQQHAGSNGAAHSDSSSSGGVHVFESLTQQQCLKRALCEVGAFRLPEQTNRLALLFGPHASPAVCCSFGVEVFEPGHVTPLHIHNTAHELFFVLAGRGEAVFRYDGVSGDGGSTPQRVAVGPGDVAVFPPGVVHGLDNPSGSQLAALQMMLPNEAFVEWVQSGQEAGVLDVTLLQRLAAAASCG